MDIRAGFHRARGRTGRRGWAWVCYSHPRPVRRFYPERGRLFRWWRAQRGLFTPRAEGLCRGGLHAHLFEAHPESLED